LITVHFSRIILLISYLFHRNPTAVAPKHSVCVLNYMSEDTDKIYTEGVHIYDVDPDDERFAYCRDCGVKVSRVEIDRHHHRLKCEGESR